jgi:bifunctional DNA-binding transcriptional regulator/antitoxin component of YhaV-PrlF toxin-antitoxin module
MASSRKPATTAPVAQGTSMSGRVSPTGRLSLPASLRRAVGLERGGPVRIAVVDGTITVRTMNEVKDRIRALARSSGLINKASVSDFLEWRDAERVTETKKSGKR